MHEIDRAIEVADGKGFDVIEAHGPRAADVIASAVTIAVVTGSRGARSEYCAADECEDDSVAVVERR